MKNETGRADNAPEPPPIAAEAADAPRMTAEAAEAAHASDVPQVVPAEAPQAGGSGTADLLRLLVASVVDYAIFALDPTGHILTWNAGAERLKGYSAAEIVGQHFSVFYPEEAIARAHPEYELEVATREGRYTEEGWRLRKGGTPFWASVTITALRDGSGALVGFAKVTRDLTERRAAEEQALKDARRLAEAEASSRAKSQFLASMSHELRTPLNAIGGYVDLLTFGVHGPLTDAQKEALERVRGSQQHLLLLINDLLNFSRIGAGGVTYAIGPLPLSEVANEVAPMIELQAAAAGVAMEWQPADAAVVARADRARVEQILLNLVHNAVKNTPRGGTITVRHFLRDGRAVLEVSDTGVGIAPEDVDAIFEPFTQLGRSLTSTQEGTGLGLAISRDLARAMNGDLTVQSTVGEGSTFSIILPRGANK